MDKKEFPLSVILSMTTGHMLCKFNEMQEMCGWMVNGTPFTLTAAHLIKSRCVPALLDQHPQLKKVEVPDIEGEDAWKFWVSGKEAIFGKSLIIERLSEVK